MNETTQLTEKQKDDVVASWLMSRAVYTYHDKLGLSYPEIISMLVNVYLPKKEDKKTEPEPEPMQEAEEFMDSLT